ncbi:MAG: metal-dependent hydrolase [Gemmatimonadaceae bacterium]
MAPSEHKRVDNICHTLAGAALARTGLRSRTALASATMMIGANFPDIDIVAGAFGRATEFRRGWTHGVLALVVLPFVLTGLMMLWDRYARRGRDPAVPKQLLLLSALSILTHPTLDWMNSYGLRWLMPFDGTWFYGDSLFIVDPYLLVVLGAGVWFSRRRERTGSANPWKPARLAVGLATTYIVMMLGLQHYAEGFVKRELAGTGLDRQKLVVTASPGNPSAWRVHADDGDGYSTGSVAVLPTRLSMNSGTLDKGAKDVAVAAAMRHPSAGPFLDWARLPFFRVEETPAGTLVRITDARYGATITVPVTP